MYSREEASQIRKKFWVSFNNYMKLHPSAGGMPVNWVNYKTGIKDLFFKTDADNKTVRIAVEIRNRDEGIQSLIYEQFEELKDYFESEMGGEWIWFKETWDEVGKPLHKIELKLEGVSIFRESDWPEIITFLKNNLLKLDEFWNDVKDIFDIFR